MNFSTKLVTVAMLLMGIFFSVCMYLCFKSVQTIQALNNRLDRANVEYQFVVTDSMMTVYDANRVVGTVKLEGQLDSLITSDNQ